MKTLLIAALAAFIPAAPQQGGSTCPCAHTVDTIKSPDSECEVVWAGTLSRDGACPRDMQQNCTINGSLGCQATGSIFEVTCGGSKQVSMSTPTCQDVDAAAMTPSDDSSGAPHTAYLNCADCSV